MKRVVQQVLVGLEFLHDQCGLVHANLKTDNILVKFSGEEMVG